MSVVGRAAIAHEPAREPQVLRDRERREHSFAARCVADPARRDPLGSRVGDVVAFDGDGAVARSHQTRHGAQQRRLARAVRAEQRDDLARGDVEVDAEEHLHAVVLDVEPAHRDRATRLPAHGWCGRLLRGRRRRRRPGGEAASTCHEPEEHVPQVGERGAEPAGKHEEHDEEPRAGCEDLPVDGQRPCDAADIERTERARRGWNRDRRSRPSRTPRGSPTRSRCRAGDRSGGGRTAHPRTRRGIPRSRTRRAWCGACSRRTRSSPVRSPVSRSARGRFASGECHGPR